LSIPWASLQLQRIAGSLGDDPQHSSIWSKCSSRWNSMILVLAGNPNAVPLWSLNLRNPGDLGTAEYAEAVSPSLARQAALNGPRIAWPVAAVVSSADLTVQASVCIVMATVSDYVPTASTLIVVTARKW